MKIIVIGATGTIGSEVVRALAARNHEVIGASRKGEVKVDLQDSRSIEQLFATVENVDAVVSCAGDAAFKPLTDLTDADFELSLRSKLMGQVNLGRIAASRIREKGSVTLTSGILAMQPMSGSAAISLVNAGLEGFVRAAGLEAPGGVRFNAVSPPWITETLVKYGMDPASGLPAKECAMAYVAVVEGAQQGAVVACARHAGDV
jgi:NAD(P)-dependent dehydrogenase (short-subunit alcohol dehydrogenase family)